MNIVEKLTTVGTGIITFLRYLKSFKWVVDIARWIQDTGAVIAESAFTLAIIYVIVFTFGHLLLAWIPDGILTVVNQIVLIVFVILPELVMLPIILTTSDHFQMARRTKDNKSYAWFVAYALLTVLFVTLTLILLSGLQGGIVENATQSTGPIFILRCFSGLFYTVLQRLWDGKGKSSYTSQYDKMTTTIGELRVSLSQNTVVISELRVSLSQLQQTVVTLEQERMSLSVALAQKKLSRNVATEVTTESKKVTTPNRSNGATVARKVTTVLDQGDEVAMDERNITPIDIHEKREKIKNHVIIAVKSGKRINYKKVASDAGVSYGMVQKHKEDILKEISQELPAIAK